MTQRAAIYARTCIDDGRSLAEQVEACREYAQDRGFQVVVEYAEAGPGAGDRVFVPIQLNHALGMARAGEFEVLVVRDAYRLSRCLASYLSIVGELQGHGVSIEYVSRVGCGILTDGPKKDRLR